MSAFTDLYASRKFVVGAHYGIEEEGFCDQCGRPMLVNDAGLEIWFDYDKTEPISFVCSQACARAEIEKLASQEAENQA